MTAFVVRRAIHIFYIQFDNKNTKIYCVMTTIVTESGRSTYRVVQIGKDQDCAFINNHVKTTKYELWNFLPKFLFEEFNPRVKLANCYFLMIAGFQCIGEISDTSGVPTYLMPLAIILTISGIFAVREDILRRKADKTANSSRITKLKYNNSEQTIWENICVGDYIKVFNRETVPVDMIILYTSQQNIQHNGICFIETKSFDGETNLKIRRACKSTYNLVRYNLLNQ